MTAPFGTLDELLMWLDTLPLVERYRVANLLVSQRTTKAVAQVRKGVVYEMTRDRTYAQVAEELGMGSVAAVNKAVTEHRRAAA